MSRKIHDGSDARSTRPPRMRASSDGERREAIAPHPPVSTIEKIQISMPPRGHVRSLIQECQDEYEQAQRTGRGMYGSDAVRGHGWMQSRQPRDNIGHRKSSTSPRETAGKDT